jgi:hypothetical protein
MDELFIGRLYGQGATSTTFYTASVMNFIVNPAVSISWIKAVDWLANLHSL